VTKTIKNKKFDEKNRKIDEKTGKSMQKRAQIDKNPENP